MNEDLIVGLVLLDVASTLAGNWILWSKLNIIDKRVCIIETENSMIERGYSKSES
jgi:hypothetical protein